MRTWQKLPAAALAVKVHALGGRGEREGVSATGAFMVILFLPLSMSWGFVPRVRGLNWKYLDWPIAWHLNQLVFLKCLDGCLHVIQLTGGQLRARQLSLREALTVWISMWKRIEIKFYWSSLPRIIPRFWNSHVYRMHLTNRGAHFLYQLSPCRGIRSVREDRRDTPRVRAFECRSYSDRALQHRWSQYWLSSGFAAKERWHSLPRRYWLLRLRPRTSW